MDDKTQQIEALIKLIELNLDKTWLSEFRSLRDGGYLPGGGAGSLNDWGPSFRGELQHAWYSNLYEILRYLFDNALGSDKIDECNSVKFRNNIQIIRCLSCDKNYQHPTRFESHIALDFYQNHVAEFSERRLLVEILLANRSFESEKVIDYRNWLLDQYEINETKVFNFVEAKYVCPHCETADFKTEHDLYKISSQGSGSKRFELFKKNASWEDFVNDGTLRNL